MSNEFPKPSRRTFIEGLLKTAAAPLATGPLAALLVACDSINLEDKNEVFGKLDALLRRWNHEYPSYLEKISDLKASLDNPQYEHTYSFSTLPPGLQLMQDRLNAVVQQRESLNSIAKSYTSLRTQAMANGFLLDNSDWVTKELEALGKLGPYTYLSIPTEHRNSDIRLLPQEIMPSVEETRAEESLREVRAARRSQ